MPLSYLLSACLSFPENSPIVTVAVAFKTLMGGGRMTAQSRSWFFLSFYHWNLQQMLEEDVTLLKHLVSDAGGVTTGAPPPSLLDEATRELAREVRGEGTLREAFALLGGKIPVHDRHPCDLHLFRVEGETYRYVRNRYRLPMSGLLFPLFYLHASLPAAVHAWAWEILRDALGLSPEAAPGLILLQLLRRHQETLSDRQGEIRALVEAIADHRDPPKITIPLSHTLTFPLIGQGVRPQMLLTLSQVELPFFDLAQYLLRHGERLPPKRCTSCSRIFLPPRTRRTECEACRQ